MCSRIQTSLFLATLLEENADRCNMHKEGYTIFNRVACKSQKARNDLTSVYRGTDTLWNTMQQQRDYALSEIIMSTHTCPELPDVPETLLSASHTLNHITVLQ